MRNLLILTSAFPFNHGEFFIKDELKIIKKEFSKVHVLCISNHEMQKNVVNDENVSYSFIRLKIPIFFKIKLLSYMFTKFFWADLGRLKKKGGNPYNPKMIYYILSYMNTAFHISKLIKNQMNLIGLKSSDTILYSYWADEKSLGISLLKNTNEASCVVTRVHRVDLYDEFAIKGFLPFRGVILKYSNAILSISKDGCQLLGAQFPEFSDKILISRLGKINDYNYPKNRINKVFVICSCSALIPVKRVDRIINILSQITESPIKWVHFGGGILEETLKSMALKNLTKISFEFKGNVNNEEIMLFYSKNFVDLFINMSESEGIPVSIMEAQSFGIPVIATNVGGTKEIVNNENGFLIDKNLSDSSISLLIKDYLVKDDTVKRELSRLNWVNNFNAKTNYRELSNNLLNLK